MALLEILEFPDTRLRKVARSVVNIDTEMAKLADDMLETMYQAPGIGLAATQVNIHKRLLVTDVSERKDAPLILFNPIILHAEGSVETDEGCLSVPGFYEPIVRAEHIRVSAVSQEGSTFEMDASGSLAVCIQHEIDHLDGKLFVDYLSTIKRQIIRKRLLKAQRQRA